MSKVSFKYYSAILVSISFLMFASGHIVNAQKTQDEVGAQVNELKAQAQQNRSQNVNQATENVELRERLRLEIQQKLEERKATRAASLTDKRKTLISDYFDRLSVRLEAMINRLETLTSRIEMRLAKIEEDENLDKAKVEAEIAEARVLLENAREKLTAAKDNLDLVLDSNDPKEAFTIIRNTIHEVKDNLTEVHRILVLVIDDIKGLRVGQNELNDNGTNVAATPTTKTIPTLSPSVTPTTAPVVTVTE